MWAPEYRNVISIVVVVVVSLVAFGITRAEGQAQESLALPVGTSFSVVPASDSPFRGAEVSITTGKGDRLHVSVNPTLPQRPFGRQSVFIVIDPKSRVYRAAEMTVSPTVNAFRINQVMERFGRPTLSSSEITATAERRAAWLQQPFIALDILPPCNECEEDPCQGYADAFLETHDPPNVDLTLTESLVSWDREDTGNDCTWDVSIWPSCWAANPSSLGTHWFISSCGGAVLEDDEFELRTKAFGYFWNDDFGLNALRTWVDTEIYTEVDEGVAVPDIDYNWVAYGEWGFLLHSHWETEWSNGCF